jgi:hypothetical protein
VGYPLVIVVIRRGAFQKKVKEKKQKRG